MNTQILIPIFSSKTPINSSISIKALQRITALFVSLQAKTPPEAKLLAYMVNYSDSGYYYAGKGARELCLQRIGISKASYQEAIRKLKSLKLIKQCRNGSGSQYHYYEVLPKTGISQKLIDNEGIVDLVISVRRAQ